MSRQLTWTHYRNLLSSKDINEIDYYIKISIEQNLSYRQLYMKIKNKEYEKLEIKTKEKLIKNDENKIEDFIKNPILIKNNLDYKEISEKVLKQLILEDLDNFLTELGDGFTYIKSGYDNYLIKQYLLKLTKKLGKGYSSRNLYNMRTLYLKFKDDDILQSMIAKLSWTHVIQLLSIENLNKLRYYTQMIENQNLSVRELRNKIKNIWNNLCIRVGEVMDYYKEIKQELINNEIYKTVKDKNAPILYYV